MWCWIINNINQLLLSVGTRPIAGCKLCGVGLLII